LAQLLEQLRHRARASGATLVLPEGDDPRILEAAAQAPAAGLGNPAVVGDPAAVQALAQEHGIPVTFPILDPRDDEDQPALAAYLGRRLAAKRRPPEEIAALALEPLHYACLLVATGRYDGAVMGARATTAETLRAALRCVGPRPGLKTVSSCFLMVLPDGRGLIYSDCAVVPDPSPTQLADIADAAAQSCRDLLGAEPQVAMLSFSTHGSAQHPLVERVRQGLAELERRQVSFAVDGELQADAALVPDVGRRKAPNSTVAGQANVLVFPNLDAGNIAYKLTQRLAGARAVGPLLQGLDRPVHDLSRGCSTADVLDAMAVAAVQRRRA
jgi:phosphate acetyltransferase